MSYYDQIADQWHRSTRNQGGALKRLLLNDLLIDRIGEITGRSILELGAGTGYFIPLLLRRFSGRLPSRIVITDISQALLDLAQRDHRVPEAEYLLLDLWQPCHLPDASFDLLIASMVFNELPTSGLRAALLECHRVLRPDGRLVGSIVHPKFVESLSRRGKIKMAHRGLLTMPGKDGLRLPIVMRSWKAYESAFKACGFTWDTQDVLATPELLRERPGLKEAGNVPLAAVFTCEKLEEH